MDMAQEDSLVAFVQLNQLVKMTKKLQEILQYQFKNEELLQKAVTHSSINSHIDGNYERLEFLGDRVLGVATASLLYRIFSQEPEGSLSQRFVRLVCKETVAEMALSLKLDHFMKVLSDDLRRNDNVLCDVMEAVIGAIYIDGGIDAAVDFVSNHWRELIDKNTTPPKDAKTALQEWAQHYGLSMPEYRVVRREGSEHEPIFVIEVAIGQRKASGQGHNKKQAEFAAAKALLELVQK